MAKAGSSTGAGTLAGEQAKQTLANAEGVKEDRPKYPQIYAGLRIVPNIGELSSQNLEIALKKHGAELVPLDAWQRGEAADYMVVRL